MSVHLLGRHLSAMKARRVQDVTATDSRGCCGSCGSGYSRGRASRSTGSFAARSHWRSGAASSAARRSTGWRRLRVRSNGMRAAWPCSTPRRLAALVAAGSSARWRAAFGLAGFAGLRVGEIRALRWSDVNLDTGTIAVTRSMLPDGAEGAEDGRRRSGGSYPACASAAAGRVAARVSAYAAR